jgi:predicted dehydrogenase
MVKVGLVGAGHLGKIHLRCIKQIDLFELVGFYDANPEVRQSVESEFGVKAFDTLSDLMQLCDAIDVVTPTTYHFDCAAMALKQNKHVFIEKPVTSTIEESKQLKAINMEANRVVQIGHVERFNPAYRATYKEILHPMFIETHRLAQFNPRGTDVSVVLDLMIHDLDIVLSVVKSPIKKIHASGVAIVSDSPDIANARIEFDNGCVANLTASRISMKNMRKTRLFQKTAYISIDFLEKKSEVIKIKQEVDASDPFALVIDLGEKKGKKQIYFEMPEIPNSNAIEDELREFADCIMNGKQPTVTLDHGHHCLQVANEIVSKIKLSSGIDII